MSDLRSRVDEAAQTVRERLDCAPETGIILGTGLGDLAREIKNERSIRYDEIPHFPTSTVESHAGQLIAGELSGKPVLVMGGRFHAYEGYSLEHVTFPEIGRAHV
jgi:purine-nucleoside phosphorylase